MRALRAGWVAVGIGVAALVLAGLVSFYASSSPDGLNRVAQDQGFSDTGHNHQTVDWPFAGYQTQHVDNARFSRGVAGMVGVVVVLALVGGIAHTARKHRPRDADHSRDPDRDVDSNRETAC
jgi:hypothetical protein